MTSWALQSPLMKVTQSSPNSRISADMRSDCVALYSVKNSTGRSAKRDLGQLEGAELHLGAVALRPEDPEDGAWRLPAESGASTGGRFDVLNLG
jgi:hypothetical protein